MQFYDAVVQRRSVNFFDPDRDVPEDLLRKLVETAALAPSGFNLQPWNLIVLREPDAKARLRKLAWDQPKVTEAPVVLVALADRKIWQPDDPGLVRTWEEMLKAGMPEGQKSWFVDACSNLYGSSVERELAFANKNVGLFLATLMLAAKDLGLDTHPMDGFDLEGVRKAFAVPDRFWIPMLIAVGYFREKEPLPPAKWRKSYDEIVVNFL